MAKILRSLQEASFDADAIRIMGEAFDSAQKAFAPRVNPTWC